MKQTSAAKNIIITAIALFLCSNSLLAEDVTVSKLNWFKRTFKTLTWDEVSQKVNTPKEICSSVRHHVAYRADQGDDWASGKETWDRGYGDCEDYAAAIAEICKNKDIETLTFMIYPESEDTGHVVVVGLWKNKLWFSSNGWFEHAKNGADIKRKVAHQMRWKQKNIIAMEWNDFRGLNPDIIPSASKDRMTLPIIGN